MGSAATKTETPVSESPAAAAAPVDPLSDVTRSLGALTLGEPTLQLFESMTEAERIALMEQPQTENEGYVIICRSEGDENYYFYVGVSINVKARCEQHNREVGCAWTKLHKPLPGVVMRFPVTELAEDFQTKILMRRIGLEFVRGGTYNAVELSKAQLKILQSEFDTADNNCFLCHQPGHQSRACPHKVTKVDPSHPKLFKGPRSPYCCGACNQPYHGRANCPELKRLRGEESEDAPTKMVKHCSICKASGHNKKKCPTVTPAAAPVVSTPSKSYSCSNCGESGHNKNKCSQPVVVKVSKVYSCSNCGEPGHNKNKCSQPVVVKASAAYTCSNCGTLGHNRKVCPQPAKLFCERCKRNTHDKSNCKARTQLDGTAL